MKSISTEPLCSRDGEDHAARDTGVRCDFKMIHIHIIGTNHEYQNGENVTKEDILSFKAYLEFICQQYSIKAIAEEMNREALSEVNQLSSTCESLAEELSIVHRYCDPDRTERKKLGIRQENDVRLNGFSSRMTEEEIRDLIRNENVKRENIWLKHIQEINIFPLLFVCGANHVNSFSKITSSSGFLCNILCDDWTPIKPMNQIGL